jgi:hypothetical protein
MWTVSEASNPRTAGRLQRKESRSTWCRRRDLNPHGLRHTPLKRACLPFHHFGTLAHDGCLSVHFTSPVALDGPAVTNLVRRTRKDEGQTIRREKVTHYRSGLKCLSIN